MNRPDTLPEHLRCNHQPEAVPPKPRGPIAGVDAAPGSRSFAFGDGNEDLKDIIESSGSPPAWSRADGHVCRRWSKPIDPDGSGTPCRLFQSIIRVAESGLQQAGNSECVERAGAVPHSRVARLPCSRPIRVKLDPGVDELLMGQPAISVGQEP